MFTSSQVALENGDKIRVSVSAAKPERRVRIIITDMFGHDTGMTLSVNQAAELFADLRDAVNEARGEAQVLRFPIPEGRTQ